MLVCNVVVRPRAVTVTADIIEAAAALDAPATAMLFGTLLDSPGNAQDFIIAFIGQQVGEAANAADSVTVSMVYKIAVLEDTTAVAAVQVVPRDAAGLLETATATATQDATLPAALVPRSGMVGLVFVNSSGTPRQANADGIMVNL